MQDALRADRERELQEAYAALFDRDLAEDDSTDWLDTKDYLYTHVRLARFHGAVGYWKEIAGRRLDALASLTIDGRARF